MKRILSMALTLAMLCSMVVITATNDIAFAAGEIVRNTVSLGRFHSAAIKTDGSLWMWGYNYYGQLGNSTTIDCYMPMKIMDNVASVSPGDERSAAIKTDGSLWMWGEGEHGRLSNGTTTNSSTPIKIMDNVASVSLGDEFFGVIKTDGSLWMWGWNEFGQLGNGTKTDSSTPIKIMDNVASVSLGAAHSAAIKTDGSLWTWGNGSFGMLGNGTAKDSSTPIKIMDNVTSVSLGQSHSAAIKTDGSLWMWGWNHYGQLGNGTAKDSSTPIKIMDNVASVSLGDCHSAAIKIDGSLWVWGDNINGQLGNCTTTKSSTPIKIMDNVASVSLGGDMHSAAIKTDGSLWMWGDNFYGKLGNGTTTDSYTPIKIMDDVALPGTIDTNVNVLIPTFKITINNQVIDNTYLQYPYIVYNGITYFPMTYFGARFLGLQTAWSAENGLDISKLEGGSIGNNDTTMQSIMNAGSYPAKMATGKIVVNSKNINNLSEQYPLLLFREVTYFPLTWRFAVDEFGWQYNYTNENGLEINSEQKKKETNKLSLSVEQLNSVTVADYKTIKIVVKNLSEDVITVIAGSSASVDKAESAKNLKVSIVDTDCLKAVNGNVFYREELKPGASYTIETSVKFDCYKEEKCGEKHNLKVVASADGFETVEDTIALKKPVYIDPYQVLLENAGLDLAKRSTDIVNSLCYNTQNKTSTIYDITSARNEVKKYLGVKGSNLPDEIYDIFATAILQGLVNSNKIDSYDTDPKELAKQIYEQIEAGLVWGNQQVVNNGIKYDVQYNVWSISGIGVGSQFVKWTDKKNVRHNEVLTWTTSSEDSKNAVANFCALLAQLNTDVWQEFSAYFVTDALGLMGIDKIKKDDVVKVFDTTEKVINALCDKNEGMALAKIIGSEFEAKLKEWDWNPWNNEFKKYVEENVPNGDLIVTAAEKYQKAKEKYNLYKSLLSGDYDIEEAEELYNDFKTAYNNLENAINNI